MVRTLWFDLGGVFIHMHAERGLARLSKALDIESSAFLREAVFDPRILSRYETGRLSTSQFHAEVCGRLGREIPLSQFREVWQEIFSPNRPMIRFLSKLKSRYRLLLVSNTNEMHMEFIIGHYPFLDMFDTRIYSYETGIAKPDRGIFMHALEASKAGASECLFVDDSPENVRAAESLGIRSHRFEGNRAFFAYWRKEGLDPAPD
jgi:putative hydrolase of the HAD superfamily